MGICTGKGGNSPAGRWTGAGGGGYGGGGGSTGPVGAAYSLANISGAVGAAGGAGWIYITAIAPPPPPPPVPASAPLHVAAAGVNGSAEVSWESPRSPGSFPVSNYQVQATPGFAGCVVPASSTACRVGALRNGQQYEIRVRALTGAGWGSWSDPVAVVPQPLPPVHSMLITGSREGGAVVVDGVTTGMVGERVMPWLRFPGPHAYEPVGESSTVSADGRFTWNRETGKKVYLYFRAGDGVRSNRVIIPAR